MSKFIDDLITKSGVAIDNGLNEPTIANLLREYGYTPERLAVGKEIQNKAVTLNYQQKKEDGEQQDATKVLNESFDEANNLYMPHLKVARIAFRNDTSRWIQLVLSGKRKKTQSGWLGQSKVFYANLLSDPEALDKMAQFGQTKEKLEAASKVVYKVEQNLAERKKEMGEAQDATKARDLAIDELQDWYSDYIEIARLALSNQPQYLEMLGIISKS
ncbi:MAG: hypothetical protein N4A71_02745 [Carboxylicivirga sp.]|jgi:hypothetical protein|nr:hypothetical protein [Carboxylicivirga sp.]